MPTKMFALHKDQDGNVLGAFEFDGGGYDLSSKIRMLDLRDGDYVDFREVAQRKLPDAEVRPAPLEEEPVKEPTESVTPLIAAAEQPL